MSSPIERFLDNVRAAESRNQRELVLPLAQARDLHADITRLLLKLDSKNDSQEQNISIEFKGQDF
jgi:hypothetical protein